MSSTTTRMPAREAERVANRFLALITGSCEQAVMAGSLRRMRPDVGDIEIVAVPQVVDRPVGLFAEHTEPFNLLEDIIGRMLAEDAERKSLTPRARQQSLADARLLAYGGVS